MATSGQQEVLELFGKHLPSVAAQATTQEEKRLDNRPRKWPKPEGKGGRPASRVTRSNRGWSNNWSHWDGNDQAKLTDQVSGEDVRNLLALVTRLSLRQEDDLAATRADNAFLFYLETRTTGFTARSRATFTPSPSSGRRSGTRRRSACPSPSGPPCSLPGFATPWSQTTRKLP